MNKTNKTMYWVVWAITLIGINCYALPLAMWSTFAGTEEAKWLWIAIAVVIYVLLNVGVIQMYVAIKQGKYRFFQIGLIVAVIQFIAMMILGGQFEGDIFLLLGTLAVSSTLMIIQLRKSPS
ncbi:hypothetical protein MHH60_10270 [Paenibacillus sp. FSL H7-0716]|uniref:Uncharacterized protein n=1 Tax=Paenibacillus odorifer TaxID=189426 RepID=A0AB36J994_9BACL|nr:hypothetical protein [Paenibacillus odorifer]OME11250.1 hypothetical protein BSK60_21650 [Paenibacillus odorifer]OME15887.1 hypothetical protein BSK47_21595 [Paenibacillus odorifer]